ncbi:MAG: hypothetical protein NUV45_09370 [Tepidanaerobacteraceae bacterium]|jgi:hypothetical protein|nr:hypothetical protein [Tepidanaerobacteraceae bacterium]
MSVPSGKYDPAIGMVTFTTTNLGYYAAANVTKTFDDLGGCGLGLEANRGITKGIGNNKFNPDASIML